VVKKGRLGKGICLMNFSNALSDICFRSVWFCQWLAYWYALIVCFLLETRKVLLDHLVKIHDQFIMDMLRKAKQHHKKAP